MELSNQIKDDILEFLKENMELFISDAVEYGELDLTIGSDGKEWSFQTGDNSFSGGAYFYANWAVVTITPEYNTPADLAEEIYEQLNELLYDYEVA